MFLLSTRGTEKTFDIPVLLRSRYKRLISKRSSGGFLSHSYDSHYSSFWCTGCAYVTHRNFRLNFP
ncbi:MAG: hypothetical protein K0Q83_711 [Deltaproteobacteria bacterium]|nr:hypothetical protein [Deltaproteobacteria bacterium]